MFEDTVLVLCTITSETRNFEIPFLQHEKHIAIVTKTTCVMLFEGVVAVYTENYTKRVKYRLWAKLILM
jgi:hypothetical protein